ncbi:MAG: hypothetical protein EOP73_28860, partial [Variovorax sp.]
MGIKKSQKSAVTRGSREAKAAVKSHLDPVAAGRERPRDAVRRKAPASAPPGADASATNPAPTGASPANATGTSSTTHAHHKERTAMNRILLVDLGEREHKTREELRGRKLKFESILANKNLDGLSPAQQREYEGIK